MVVADMRVRFEPSGREVGVAAGASLLEAARIAGLPLASSCGADGLCGRCGLRVVEGHAHLTPETADEQRVKDRNRVDSALRLACRAGVLGDVRVSAAYW